MEYQTFLPINLGCKVNAYELDSIKNELLELGLKEDKKNPDIVLINTCAVTYKAGHKSKQKISSIRSKFPKTILIVFGCYVEEKKKNKTLFKDADIILGINSKNKAVNSLKKFIETKKQIFDFSDNKKEYQEFKSFAYNTRHRTYLKIQDGCTNFCSYCLIPFLRRGIQSRSKEKIFEEVEFLKAQKVKEIVLSGIHVGVYGKEKKDGYFFYDLLKDLLTKFPDINFRLSSLEISEMNNEFFKLFSKYKNLMPFLHIPLQSGSNKVLKDMNRHYDSNLYLNAIKEARKYCPNICISSDVIVGFPTETEDDFFNTIQTLEKAKISFLHVFPFSSREGTASSKLTDLQPSIKKERSNVLLKLSSLFLNEYQKSLIGKESHVLLEKFDSKNQVFIGTSDEYLDVQIKGNYKIGDYIPFKYKKDNF